MSIEESSNRTIDPASALSLTNRNMYPNQFFDLSQQYMPPTIKELFRWCTFYYYNSPLIGSTINKISRYPITDLIIEDKNDSARALWENLLAHELKIKDKLLEINLDLHVYGNCFVSLHLPFTRFLKCKSCSNNEPISQLKWTFDASSFGFRLQCKKCGVHGIADVSDRPYKNRKGIKIVRWNPENINIKYNEYTGRYVYMYSVPNKLKNAILRGDKDILEDIPMIVVQAVRERRYIRFNSDNLFHVKRPTLAEQDQGWGKPVIMHVLKDMYYLYTLRRAQEAIALEHVVPFDILYPLPNAQVDPYVHTDLASWRNQIEGVIRKHRKDPNFKAVIPIPVGFGRLGGDGKAMMLTPELNYLNQTIVGGMGVPQEFLFGGLNYTGSSISLRTLENDFIQARTQLLDLVHWIKDKVRIWLSLPNCKEIRFADFRMADDIQRNQQLIGLNAQGKVSDQTLLTELGYNYDHEVKKMIEEAFIQNYVNDLRSKGAAKSQGEAQLVQFNYQQKIQELGEKAQQAAQAKLQAQGMMPQEQLPPALPPQEDAQAAPPPNAQQGGDSAPAGAINVEGSVKRWASKLRSMPPSDAAMALTEIKSKLPEIGSMVEQAYEQGPRQGA